MLLADRTPQDLTSIRHRKMMGRRASTTAARLRHFSPFCLCSKRSCKRTRLRRLYAYSARGLPCAQRKLDPLKSTGYGPIARLTRSWLLVINGKGSLRDRTAYGQVFGVSEVGTAAQQPKSLDVYARRGTRPPAFSSSPIERRYGPPSAVCVSRSRVALQRQASTWTTPSRTANARH
jgi:hypothetical protein